MNLNAPAPPGIEWRPIPGFNDFKISECGHVRRIRGFNHHCVIGQLRCYLHRPDRYWTTDLFIGPGKRARVYVHRLVCLAFHGEPPFPEAQALHADDNKSNNHHSNIRWGSRGDNGIDAVANARMATGERNGAAKLKHDQVAAILASNDSQRVLSARYGISRGLVYQIRARKVWRHVAAS